MCTTEIFYNAALCATQHGLYSSNLLLTLGRDGLGSSSQSVNSQNLNSPKISNFDKILCVSYFTTCQTLHKQEHYQAHFHYILCGTWDGGTQELDNPMISRPTYAHIDMMTVITTTLKLLHLQWLGQQYWVAYIESWHNKLKRMLRASCLTLKINDVMRYNI